MRDALEVLQEYGRRNAGNPWAQQLTRMKAFQAVPGEPASGGVARVVLEAWVPRVGGECVHQAWDGQAERMTVLELDGGFTKVADSDGEVYWVLTAQLHPVMGS